MKTIRNTKAKAITSFALLLALTLTPVLGFAKEDNASKSKNDGNRGENHFCIKAFGQLLKGNVSATNCPLPFGIFKKLEWGWHPVASSTDAVAPAISSFTIASSENKAVVKWSANENVRAVVFYGTTTPQVVKVGKITNDALFASVYSTSSMSVVDTATLGKNGEINIKDLKAGTTYYAILAVRDRTGNVTVSNAIAFTTTSNADVTAPVISNIVTSISFNKLFINWKTNEPATTKVFYGTSTINVHDANTKSLSNNSLKTNHSFELAATASTTPYHVILQATDAVGNVNTSVEYSIYSPF